MEIETWSGGPEIAICDADQTTSLLSFLEADMLRQR